MRFRSKRGLVQAIMLMKTFNGDDKYVTRELMQKPRAELRYLVLLLKNGISSAAYTGKPNFT